MNAEIFGYIGGILIMISFIPQAVKSYKTKSVKDLSISLIVATIIGTVFWEIYGLMIKSYPLIVMNGIFGVIVLFQLYLKVKYEKK